jgi:hypothetical protein
MRWTGHLTRMDPTRNAWRKGRVQWERQDVDGYMGWSGICWIDLAQDRARWALVQSIPRIMIKQNVRQLLVTAKLSASRERACSKTERHTWLMWNWRECKYVDSRIHSTHNLMWDLSSHSAGYIGLSFLIITSYSLHKASRRFGVTFRIKFQDQITSLGRNQLEESSSY